MIDNTKVYSHVQSLTRGLAILRYMNQSPGGAVTVNMVSQHTSLHRTTVRRILETLMTEGYVIRSSSDGSYRLTFQTRQLSDGYTHHEWISEIAAPVLGQLLQKVIWPSDLCTLDGDCMLVRETTHRFSALSFHRAMIRQRLPLLFTAAGRAYLAFCSDEEREQLFNILLSSHPAQAQFLRQPDLIKQMLHKFRVNGYATNDSEWLEQKMVGGLAVPIFYDDRVLATINIVFLRKAMTLQEAEQRYIEPLMETKSTIENMLVERFPLTGKGMSWF